MIRGVLGLSLFLVAPVYAEMACVKALDRAPVELAAAARPYAASAIAVADPRPVYGFRAERCVLASGSKIEVLARHDELVTLRVLDGSSKDCVGELSSAHVGRCLPVAPRATGRPADGTDAAAGVASRRVFGDRVAPRAGIAKWRTANGRIFFGDRAPVGSTKIGEVEAPVPVTPSADPWRPVGESPKAESAAASIVRSDASALEPAVVPISVR